MKVFVEAAPKRVFAGALDWPGLARSGKTEQDALQMLAAYVPRYRAHVGGAARELKAVTGAGDLDVVSRLTGAAGTEFGVPSAIADFDREPLDDNELERQLRILRAAWRAVDSVAREAGKRQLATGPRGGGRSLEKILEHVDEADRAYIAQLGARSPRSAGDRPAIQEAFVEAVRAKLRGELPERGPRGGERWPARYAIRRSAWHALDHAWEIEDRSG